MLKTSAGPEVPDWGPWKKIFPFCPEKVAWAEAGIQSVRIASAATPGMEIFTVSYILTG
jgi:hypothetical protein